MTVRDLDWQKWKSFLRAGALFNPATQVLQVPDMYNKLQNIDPDSEYDFRNTAILQQLNYVQDDTFWFRMIEIKNANKPIDYVNIEAPSTEEPTIQPVDVWSRSREQGSGSGKRARPGSSDESQSRKKPRGSKETPGSASKAQRAGKLAKYEERDKNNYSPWESDVDVNDPNGDGGNSNDEDNDSEYDDVEDDDLDDVKQEVFDRRMNGVVDDCEQWDRKTWEDCCEFFRMDSTNESRDQTALVKLDETSTAQFKVFQAYGIYNMMLKSRGLAGGGFLADEQGLGKTRQGLGFCIMEHILANAWDRINADQKANGGEHNLAANFQAAEFCPCEKDGAIPFSIPCPCWNGSVSGKLPPKRGPSIVIAPPGLLNVWSEEFEKLTGNAVANGVSSVPGQDRFPMELAIFHGNHIIPQAQKARVTKWLENPMTAGTAARVMRGLTKYIAVSSSASFENYASKTWSNLDTIPWGRAIIDEHHFAFNHDTNAVKMIRLLSGEPHTWMLSGTPFESTPANLDGWIEVLRRRKNQNGKPNQTTWANTSFHHARKKELADISAEYVFAVNNSGKERTPGGQDAMVLRLAEILRALMIRRTTDSLWFDQKMVLLKWNNHHKVMANPNSAFDTYEKTLRAQSLSLLKKGEKRAAKKPTGMALQNSSRMLRIAATFPAISRIIVQEKPDFTMTQKDILPAWYKDSRGSSYATYLDELYQSSDKITRLAKILTTVRNGKDYLKRPEKIIVLSTIPAVAFIISLWIKKLGMDKAILVHSKSANRAAIMDGFQMNSLSQYKDKGTKVQRTAYVEGTQATILISTCKVVGVGYTLTRSFRVVLMEPAWLRRDEEQGFSRVKRIGQMNAETHTYRMMNKGSVVEKIIAQRQNSRYGLSADAFKAAVDEPDFGDDMYDASQDETDEYGMTYSQKEIAAYKKKANQRQNQGYLDYDDDDYEV
ncbi:uncharacterized protein LY89DRAFT_56935 [Mollisia scopiformis]|uniref:Helicase ATP-binding domain-containing protein n=1 Tax=Mollisia scopiformis TaxID=149040 RepID=A0A194XBM1_MOLSC|nr:uncharacterized protein LY89DRAFT_56935 [Mollisia scopiformis]KUJ17565.1 hypothetical protein LY89DRAFT_56935 [Mollisia scopiformis]